ncbi:hypothetical protein J4729_00360 [Leisingera sp. HS039]|uniref:DUF6477 family protein n=1 Tax=unclassified Leisingera TaxID=2614906 RepID=UPI001070BD39|nr:MULTISPECIES: DUF6477 family protein [unclassified Leisingera]MBQ4823012.1 hypothetical protein [Leisingera sp. HS039]MCF6429331.1 DUF6477 family protein [Leisingera sp. MMG026]QBR36253.1 hypothetical protein ETW23_08955 [Leisingera sp. NJS201]
MQDVYTRLTLLRRPRILARAARLGAQNYSRQRDLRRILGYGTLPKPAAAVMQLLELESAQDTARKAGEAGYSLIRHVDVLIALAGEAAFLRNTATRPKTETAAFQDRRSAAAEATAPCP